MLLGVCVACSSRGSDDGNVQLELADACFTTLAGKARAAEAGPGLNVGGVSATERVVGAFVMQSSAMQKAGSRF